MLRDLRLIGELGQRSDKEARHVAQRESVWELIVSAGEDRLGDALGENDSHGAAHHPARAQ